MEQKQGSTSHKGEQIKSYTVDFKLEAIAFAKSCNNKSLGGFHLARQNLMRLTGLA